jgi:hypothetical protein
MVRSGVYRFDQRKLPGAKKRIDPPLRQFVRTKKDHFFKDRLGINIGKALENEMRFAQTHVPYDPPRPWVDADGNWYLALSLDACGTAGGYGRTCAAGGQLAMWRSPALRGAKANWTRISPLFTTNTTKSGANVSDGAVNNVFVTSNYIGAGTSFECHFIPQTEHSPRQARDKHKEKLTE